MEDYQIIDGLDAALRVAQERIRALEAELRAIDIACKSVAEENQALKAALREIASREDEARDIVQCNRWPSTLAIDLAGKARLALAEPETNSDGYIARILKAKDSPSDPNAPRDLDEFLKWR